VKQIVLIKTGSTIPGIKQQFGDFEDWFGAGLGVSDLKKVEVYDGQPLPDLDGLSGIVVTGSASMVSAREDWSEKTAGWLKSAVDAGVPVLGICYGHQLLAHALGGEVGVNPNGRQIGTVNAHMLHEAADDPLLGDLPTDYPVQTSHSESVLTLPPNAKSLATSERDHNFVIRFADKVWGVQYHPEFSAPVMREYLSVRADAIREEGQDPEALSSRVTDSDTALSVLRKFANMVEAA
jgi:GMP synthase (glutamine-hydrolysing)